MHEHSNSAPPAGTVPSPGAGSRRPHILVELLWFRLWSLWRFVRQVSGDDAYERYLAHMRETHPGQPVMQPADFHKAQLEQKWSRVSRCC